MDADRRLVAYGTLAPGHPNHHQLDGLQGEWFEGTVRGTLVEEGWGAEMGYPALLIDPDGSAIDVQVFESPDLLTHWSRLDEFERPDYERVTIGVEAAAGPLEASVYVPTSESPVTADETPATTKPGSAFGLVLRSPLYRRAVLSLFLGGLGVSTALPQLSLFLVQDLGASLPVAGLFFLTNLAAPVIGFLVGSWSDRMTNRLSLYRLGAVVGLIGWVLLAFATQVWMAVVVNLTLLGFAGATSSLLFAAVRDQLTREPTGADNQVISTVRLGFSLGFMTGPLVGSVLGGLVGLRVSLIVAGVFTLLRMAPLIGQTVRRAVLDLAEFGDETAGPSIGRRASLAPLVTFLSLAVLAMCGDTIRFAYLPIYMESQLGTPDWLRGLVISTQSIGMVVFIPIMGVLADRYGAHRLVVVSVALGAAANVGFALASSELALIGATILHAAMWATLGGIGITVAQDLYPTGTGMASSLYFAALQFSAAIGGIVGAVGVGFFGVPKVFLAPAALCAVAAFGLAIQARYRHRHL